MLRKILSLLGLILLLSIITTGPALARSLMSNLLKRGITTLVTTHHPDLKAYAHSTPGVINASVEFDLDIDSLSFLIAVPPGGWLTSVFLTDYAYPISGML